MRYASTPQIILAAAAALLTGVVLYLVDRGGDVYFLASLHGAAESLPPIFGRLGQYLPSALHVYAFILLTTVCLPRGPGYLLAACLSWLTIEWLFELGQHPLLQNRVSALIPDWFEKVPLLEASGSYFVNGRFDPLDLAAGAVGTGAAWVTVFFSCRSCHENI